jgi:hypothetical protein
MKVVDKMGTANQWILVNISAITFWLMIFTSLMKAAILVLWMRETNGGRRVIPFNKL